MKKWTFLELWRATRSSFVDRLPFSLIYTGHEQNVELGSEQSPHVELTSDNMTINK